MLTTPDDREVERVARIVADSRALPGTQPAKPAPWSSEVDKRVARAVLAAMPSSDVGRILSDPSAVHINMLRGGIARPSVAQIVHIYGEDALRAAMQPAGGEGWQVGDRAEYVGAVMEIRVRLIANVEGWWEVECSDGSTCIVRPSRLRRLPAAPSPGSGGEGEGRGSVHRGEAAPAQSEHNT